VSDDKLHCRVGWVEGVNGFFLQLGGHGLSLFGTCG
jgi:hypothetical protein